MSNAVKRIIQLQSSDSDEVFAKTLYKKKKKKGALLIRPLEKTVRKMVKAHKNMLKCYLKRHDKSNKKKKNGWLLDLAPNVGACNLGAAKSVLKI